MIRERHQEISDLLADALEQPREQRPAFLDRACADDADLRREVESLIASFDRAEGFIETPAFALAGEAAAPMTGERIGAWRILREIGHGGMGTVYLAERADGQYREQAALKIVRRGMDTEFVLRRFRHERQILASLHHPNIARLLDGGTTEDGRPFFVMEHIEGQPIDEYCDEQKLPIVERLALFRTVCAAAHYAHQNLVIHRDIKPANILISADGAPKLLDFGIAKILNPEISQTVEQTRTMMRLMTPEYASPEQVRGEAVTTASDVYSLGVVLYELLTGHRPYRLSTILPSDIERVICEQEPARPSTIVTRAEDVFSADGQMRTLTPEMVSRTREGQPDKLRRKLAGDLDNIVLMALRKEPARRYASVEHFSEDIRRYLEELPVSARKDTLGYRVDKFVRRNKAAVAAAALILLSLVAGLIATIWQARRAQVAQARAERHFNEVRGLANFSLLKIHDEIIEMPQATKLRRELVSKGMEYLDRLSGDAGADPMLLSELATGYIKLGDVQGHPAYPNLGDPTGALSSYHKALALFEASYRADPTNRKTKRFVANANERIGDMLERAGDLEGTRQRYLKTLASREEQLAADPSSFQARREVGVSYDRVGEMMLNAGDVAGAIESFRKGLKVGEELRDAKPAEAELHRDVGIGHQNVGKSLARAGRWEEALQHYRQALSISETLSQAHRGNVNYPRDAQIYLNKIGEVQVKSGEFQRAIETYRRALKIAEDLAAKDRENVEARLDLAICYGKLGQAHAGLAAKAGGSAHWRQARQWYQRGLDEYLQLQKRGALVGDDAAEPERLAREIAACERELKAR
jgi:non-specific serine/threonine protein kinase/serine/threonine-protein kinase